MKVLADLGEQKLDAERHQAFELNLFLTPRL